MRRVLAIVCLFVMSVTLFPARADAYFWDWLDDLSGPKFRGFVIEVRVLCQVPDARTNKAVVESLLKTLKATVTEYRAIHVNATAMAKGRPSPPPLVATSAPAFTEAALYAAEQAETAARSALAELNEPTPTMTDAQRLVKEAIVWWHRASDLAAGRVLGYDGLFAGNDAVDDGPLDTLAAIPIGSTFSVCPTKPFGRQNRYVNAQFGYGWDTKEENRLDRNRMWTAAATYNEVLTEYLTVGIGAGRAVFTSAEVARFSKWYLQGLVDFRPFALRRNSTLKGPLWQVFHLRAGVITFPRGFEAGRFGNRSDAYPQEWVRTIGLHADLEPVIRQWRNRW